MVGEIERGNRTTIEHPTGVKLAAACGASFDWLLSGRGDGPDAATATAHLVKGWGELPPPGKSGPKAKEVSP